MRDKVLGSRFKVQGSRELASEVEELYLGDRLAEELAAEASELLGGVCGVALEAGVRSCEKTWVLRGECLRG
jgi:hypothetical protein